METHNLRSGLRVHLPEKILLLPWEGEEPGGTREMLRSLIEIGVDVPDHGAAQDLVMSGLVKALQEDDLELVDQVKLMEDLTNLPQAALRGFREPELPRPAEMEMSLGPDEGAVALVERDDGSVEWRFPHEVAEMRSGTLLRGEGAAAVAMAPGERRISFRIPFDATPASLRDAGEVAVRGPWLDWAEGKVAEVVKVHVFRFVAHRGVTFLSGYLERHVTAGLMAMDSADPLNWRAIDSLAEAGAPGGRPRRVLLFIHGTFSSTKGSYGGLAATAAGRAFLEGAVKSYDAVVGYDHRTLTVDPEQNARELSAALELDSGGSVEQLDVVCFSRGGLVYRVLSEWLMPAMERRPAIGRVIFIGCTLSGTEMGRAANWHALVDRYSNLTVIAAKAMGLIPEPNTRLVAKIVEEGVQGISALVKCLATTVVTENGMPGLAAMDPGGPLVRRLNENQPGQPVPEGTWYAAVTTDFEAAGLTLGRGFPERFRMRLLDGAVDRLMRDAPNDLVVHTASMTAVDPQLGDFMKDRLVYGKNSVVFHVNYFSQERTAEALGLWLQVQPGGGPAVEGASPRVETRVVVVPGEAVTREVQAQVEPGGAGYVVLGRGGQGKTLHYALTPREIHDLDPEAGGGSLFEAAGLAEEARSPALSVGEALSQPALEPDLAGAPEGSSRRGVVVDAEGAVLGVFEPHRYHGNLSFGAEDEEGGELVNFSARGEVRGGENPDDGWRNDSGQGLRGGNDPDGSVQIGRYQYRRHATPRDILPGNDESKEIVDNLLESLRDEPGLKRPPDDNRSDDFPGTPATPAEVMCYFKAEMPAKVALKKPVTVKVTISRQALLDALKGSSDKKEANVRPDRNLIVEIIDKTNVEIEGEERLDVPVPKPGEEAAYRFDVRGTHAGKCLVQVLVRQGPVPLATLDLPFEAVDGDPGKSQRVAAEAESAEAPDYSDSPWQLRIVETSSGTKTSYRYELSSEPRGQRFTGRSAEIEGNRVEYVTSVYQKIENILRAPAGGLQDFRFRMRAIGVKLFKELFPADFKKKLWELHGQISSIQVLSEEPFIPWEIVCLVDPSPDAEPSADSPHLGELGLVRWLNLEDGNENGWPPKVLRVRPGRAFHVIPTYPAGAGNLEAAAREGDFLIRNFGSQKVQGVEGVRQLLMGPRKVDLFHYAGHADAKIFEIGDAKLILDGSVEITADEIELCANLRDWKAAQGGPDDNRPVVVLNACRAGRQGMELTHVGGFAKTFIRKGAGVFVAAQWAVADGAAKAFTENLYTALLKGGTLAEAATAARTAATAENTSCMSWLAYAVYGNAQAVLENSAAADGASGGHP